MNHLELTGEVQWYDDGSGGRSYLTSCADDDTADLFNQIARRWDHHAPVLYADVIEMRPSSNRAVSEALVAQIVYATNRLAAA